MENASIPPSNSLLLWRFMHNKLASDENLLTRSLQLPAICNVCFKQSKSSHHLIFECASATNIWLGFTLISKNSGNSFMDLWHMINLQISGQSKVVGLLQLTQEFYLVC